MPEYGQLHVDGAILVIHDVSTNRISFSPLSSFIIRHLMLLIILLMNVFVVKLVLWGRVLA